MNELIEDDINKNHSIIDTNALFLVGKMMDDALLEIDLNYEIKDANTAAKRLLGDNLIGSLIYERVISDALKDELQVCINKKDKIGEFTATLKNNEYHQLTGRLMIISDHRAAVLLMDMTLQHNVEKMRRDFISNISHELRSPLTSLMGFIETLQNTPNIENNMKERFLKIMEDEAKRMSRLIDDLMSLSKVEVEEHIAPTGKVFIKTVLSSVIASMNNRAMKTGHVIDFQDQRANKTEEPIIRGESDEIIEVFHNLIDNALKYSYSESTIKIKLTDAPFGRVIVDIVNNGEGIEAKHIPRLTERFYRVDKGRSRQMGGTGLGLAIVKHIISKHRGELHIESELKGKTKFKVSLPYFHTLLSALRPNE